MEITAILIPLRKWWWLILISMLIATTSSFLTTRKQSDIYHTSATLMVGRTIENPNPNTGELHLTQQLVTTYVDIANRRPVREGTMESLGLEWLPQYWVRAVANTQLIEIAVNATDPERARAVANELANQLILQSPDVTAEEQEREEFIAQQLDTLEIQIEETEQQIPLKRAELREEVSASRRAEIEDEIKSLESTLNNLQSNYGLLLSNTQHRAVNTIHIVEPAFLAEKPIDSDKETTILLGAMIGFVLAAGAAYLLEYLDDTLKNPADVQKVLALATLGTIPTINMANEDELVVVTQRKSAAAEAYRILRTNLQFAALERGPQSLLVTSPALAEGKTQTAANLAAALAEAGWRVILVDLNFRNPRLHRLFNLERDRGVTSALLATELNLEEHLQETHVPGLSVLTSGLQPPNPSELLGTTRMKTLLATLKAAADVVVVDSPPATSLADTAILSTRVDGVLLVVDAKKTRPEIAKRTQIALQQVNANIIGVLLNRMPKGKSGYYYHNQSASDANQESAPQKILYLPQ